MKSAQHYTRQTYREQIKNIPLAVSAGQTYREQIKNIPLAVSAGFKPRKWDFKK